ncbi:MAG: response regulator [Candidatus Omnitrophica bacterium]|nr:response regulator [Candidatus Omnitrophota bacterium]
MFSFLSNKNKSRNKSTKILLVEDNPTDQRLIHKILLRHGYTIIVADNGNHGFQLAIDEQPHLVISDFHMPIMNGVDLCKALKGHDETKTIPILMLTDSVEPSTIIDSYEVDAETFLSKPINAKILINQIDLTLKERA